MSVFDGPLVQKQQQQTSSTDQPPLDMHHQQHLNNEFAESILHQSDSDEEFDEHSQQRELDESPNVAADGPSSSGLDPSSPSKQFVSSSKAANQTRYLHYRNSLANSVRGSLLECSVPENDEEENEDESLNEEDAATSRRVSNSSSSNNNTNQQRLKKYLNSQRTQRQQSSRRFVQPPANSAASNPNEVRMKVRSLKAAAASGNNGFSQKTENNQDTAGYAIPSLLTVRRFMSTMDAGGFLNAPLNLEPVEYNLRYSLVKKCSDIYRKKHHGGKHTSTSNGMLFLDYLAYLTNYRLLINGLFLFLSLSFGLNMCGLCVVLMYVREVCLQNTGVFSSLQATFVLALIGFMGGVGRLVSTLAYKVNESNSKSRIFAYISCLFMAGTTILVSTVLCDTVFSFAMFAIIFGLFSGFSLNLRSLFVYDMIGLEWSDDSLFFLIAISQSLGVCFGLPVAGIYYVYINF